MARSSIIRRKLKPFGLHEVRYLAQALKMDPGQACHLLNGRRFGVRTAQRIGKHIGLPWEVVYSWQDGAP